MSGLPKHVQVMVLQDAKREIEAVTCVGLCTAISTSLRHHRLVVNNALIYEYIPGFTFDNVTRLCKENGIEEPSHSTYWWPAHTSYYKQERIKVINALIKQINEEED